MPGDPGEAVCRRVMVGPPPGPTVRLRPGLTSVNRLGKVRLRGVRDGRICGDTAAGLGVRLPGRRSRFEARERVGVPGGLPRG